MKTFPMFLTMTDRRVVIAGGGEQAAQKCRLMLKTEARVVIVATALEDELAGLVAAQRIDWYRDRPTVGIFADTALVFIATGCKGADAALHALAKDAGALINVVDQPALCDALTPSIVDRDPVVVAIGTEGTAPVLARQIKTRIEESLEPRLGDLAALAGRLRTSAAQRMTPANRRSLWRWVFSGAPRLSHATGQERDAARQIKQAIEAGRAPLDDAGLVSLVGAGPGSRDLITLRGVQRLQEADIIFYDRLIDDGILELARRDAERVYVGKTPGTTAWPQDRINALLVLAARQGKRVVRLKCGDPGVFGRGAEEAAALAEAGFAVEIVPGVTAAAGAAASIGQFLTTRGQTDTLVLTTGTCRAGDAAPDWGQYLRPGTTLALYMGVGNAAGIAQNLRNAGVAGNTVVEVVGSACTPDQVQLSTTVLNMASDIKRAKVSNPAMILIRSPKVSGVACVRLDGGAVVDVAKAPFAA